MMMMMMDLNWSTKRQCVIFWIMILTLKFFIHCSLMERGYSIHEIADGTLETEKARQERSLTNSSQKWDKVNEMSERFGRVLRKAMPVGGAKKVTVAANTA